MRKTLETTETPVRALMISNAGRMVSPVVWAAPETMPSASPRRDHHRAEVGDVAHRLQRELLGHPLVLAQLVVALGEGLPQRGLLGVDEMRARVRQVRPRASPRARITSGSPRIVRLTTPRRKQDVGRLEHAKVVALGQHDVLPSPPWRARSARTRTSAASVAPGARAPSAAPAPAGPRRTGTRPARWRSCARCRPPWPASRRGPWPPPRRCGRAPGGRGTARPRAVSGLPRPARSRRSSTIPATAGMPGL